MRTYILKRLLWMIPTLLGITLLSYGLMRAAPGDPVRSSLLAGGGADGAGVRQAGESEAAKAFRRRFHLDQPWYVGYWRWLVGYDPNRPWYLSYGDSLAGRPAPTGGNVSRGVLRGDFGTSIVHSLGTPVWDVIKGPMWVTIKLNLWVMFVIYAVAIPFGLYAAARKGGWGERSVSTFFFVLYSLPSYWMGLLLILAAGMWVPEWPTRGLESALPASAGYWARLADTAWHYVLPVFCLSYGGFASLSRYTRSGVLEVIRQDYVRTARAKGLAESRVLTRHVFRNALITLITLFAGLLPGLLGGSVIIEYLFNIPGMGKLGLEVLASRDYPVLMTDFGLGAALVMLGILFSDLLYAAADPRIVYQ